MPRSVSFFSIVPAMWSSLRRPVGVLKSVAQAHAPQKRPRCIPRDTSQTPPMKKPPLFRRSWPRWQDGGAGPPLRLASEAPILDIRATRGDISMNLIAAPVRVMLAAAVLAGLALPASAQGSGTTALASHRAVYDLKLSSTRGKRSMNAVRGRILYDFSGSACEGYALQFRQVSELDSGEGKVVVSDLRATSWEDGAAKRLRFHSQNFFDENLRDSVDGQAEREGNGVAVELKAPGEKKLDLKNELVFPTEHVRRIITAARDGKTLLQVAVYDGSDTGEKIYDTLTIIGKAIAPDEHK